MTGDDRLASALGFEPPRLLRELVQFTLKERNGFLERLTFPMGWAGFDWSFDQVFTKRRVRNPPRDLGMPPEFVPFGARGTGDYLGFLVFAPELGGATWPIVDYCHEGAVVLHIDDDFTEAVRLILGRHLKRLDAGGDGNHRETLERFARRAGLSIRPGAIDNGELISVPSERRGWLHFSTNDRSGVFARRTTFHPVHRAATEDPFAALQLDPEDLDAAVRLGSRMLDTGYPGTAALVFNEAFACQAFDDAAFRATRPKRIAAYTALGRAMHAQHLRDVAI